MKVLNDLRYLSWRLLDKVSKNSIYDRKQNIQKCIENDDYYNLYINDKLKEITAYAAKNTKFYSNYLNKDITEFPVINKNIIIKNMSDLKSKEFESNDNLHVMSTSGSTGIPFKVEQDSGKRNQVLAEIIYFSELVGYKTGKKLVYLRNLESGFKKSKFKKFIQNQDVISTQKYDDNTLSKIVEELIKMENNTTILGYASTLHVVASYMQRNNIKATNVSGIISGAEAITSKTRKLVKEQFNCPVVSRYSNQEMGILAQDNREDEFLLNRASYYFEILDMKSDKPVKLGEMGRIVITDLFNRAMPMIRYDTGDLGIMKKDDQGRLYLAKVFGRKLDLLYTTKDEPLSFFAFDDFFETNYDIEQYQIIQEDRTHIILNLIMKKGKTIDPEWCKSSIKSIMGEDCNVDVIFLNTIPITNSGKFRYVICNYSPN